MSSSSWTLDQLASDVANAPWRLLHDSAPPPVAWFGEQSANPTAITRHGDGEHFACGDHLGGLTLWRFHGQTMEPILHWKAHEKTIHSLVWRGDTLISGGADGFVGFWEGSALASCVDCRPGGVNGLALTPDHQTLLIASDDQTLRLWDIEAATLRGRWMGHRGWVTCVATHPSGEYAITGSADANLVLWRLADGEATVWNGHVDSVTQVRFVGSGEWVVSASRDGVIKLWEFASGKIVKTLRGHEAQVNGLAHKDDRLFSCSADYRVGVWSMDGPKTRHLGWLQGHRRGVSVVALTEDGERIVSGGNDRSLGLWNANDAHPTAIFHAGSVRSVSFSSDGEWLASGSRDETVWVRDVTNGQRVLRLVGHKGAVQGVAFSPVRSNQLLSVATDGTARLWDLASGKSEAVIQAHKDPISACAFSTDGALFFTGARDSTTKVWDARTQELLGTLEGHAHWVRTLAVHPDGQHLLTGSYDGTVVVWSIATGKVVSRFAEHFKPDGSEAPVTAVGVLPDGQHAISGGIDHQLKVWHIQTGDLVFEVEAHQGAIVGLVVHGGTVLSAGMDCKVHHWQIEDLKLSLSSTVLFQVELDSIAAFGPRVAVGDRAGHTHFLGAFKAPLRLDRTVL